MNLHFTKCSEKNISWCILSLKNWKNKDVLKFFNKLNNSDPEVFLKNMRCLDCSNVLCLMQFFEDWLVSLQLLEDLTRFLAKIVFEERVNFIEAGCFKLFQDRGPYHIATIHWFSPDWFLYDRDLCHERVKIILTLKLEFWVRDEFSTLPNISAPVEPRRSHLNFRHRACFEQGVSWHSDNYGEYIISTHVCDMIKTHNQCTKNICSHNTVQSFGHFG